MRRGRFGLKIALISLAVWLCPQVQGQSTSGSPTLSGAFTFVATGDSIIARPVSVYENEEAFRSVVKTIRDATVAFTNFETTVFDAREFTPPPQAEFGGLWNVASPTEATELKRLGFDMVSRANNHTTDWGVEVMLETNRILDQAGFVHAGSGRNLGEARAPTFFQTPVGRVAMISTASSHSPLSRAAHVRPDIRGRPGLSYLRTIRTVSLDEPTFNALRNALVAMQVSRTPPGEEEMQFFGTRIKKGDANRTELRADERDVNEILQQVRSARHQADFVFVTIHAHEPGNWSEVPPEFLEQFARATIDAGADMFIGHGPHQVRGIEIYKGRPIFYSLGNFLFQFETFGPQAADVYETYNLDLFRTTIGEFFESLKGKGLEFKEDVWWESVIAVSVWQNGALKAVELHPIDLGYGLPRAQKGTPRRAPPALARKVIDRLARLSQAYGTTVRLENNIGVVEMKGSATH